MIPAALWFYLPILILIIWALGFSVIRIWRREFGFHWLFAASGALLTWIALLIQHSFLGQVHILLNWQQGASLLTAPRLANDELAWVLELGIGTLLLGVVLTDVIRVAETKWWAWAGGFLITAIGLLSVLAANPECLLLTWAALDVLEFGLLSWHIRDSVLRERLVATFSARLGGIPLLIAGSAWAYSVGAGDNFTITAPLIAITYILAAGLRLGVFPLHQPFLVDLPLRHSLGTILRMLPALAGFVLLIRVAQNDVLLTGFFWLQVFAGVAGLFGSISWLSANSVLDGRPYWMVTISSLGVSTAIGGDPFATSAWALYLMLGGGFLFLRADSGRFKFIYIAGAFLLLANLPFTPAWLSGVGYSNGPLLLQIGFFLIHVIVLAGSLRHILRAKGENLPVERWVWGVYPLGMLLLVVGFGIAGWRNYQQLSSPVVYWQSFMPTLILIVLWFIIRFQILRNFLNYIPQLSVNKYSGFLNLNWIYQISWHGYRWVERGVGFLSQLLEGGGGVIWAILLLILIVTYLSQLGAR